MKIGCDAAINDLTLFKKLFEYQRINSQISNEAIVVLNRHCWYLTPETVMFSLFSEKVSCDEKSGIARKLLTMKEDIPTSYKLEKPKFPTIDRGTSLQDLVTVNSYKFFKILGLDHEWLSEPTDRWMEFESYRRTKDFVKP